MILLPWFTRPEWLARLRLRLHLWLHPYHGCLIPLRVLYRVLAGPARVLADPAKDAIVYGESIRGKWLDEFPLAEIRASGTENKIPLRILP